MHSSPLLLRFKAVYDGNYALSYATGLFTFFCVLGLVYLEL